MHYAMRDRNLSIAIALGLGLGLLLAGLLLSGCVATPPPGSAVLEMPDGSRVIVAPGEALIMDTEGNYAVRKGRDL